MVKAQENMGSPTPDRGEPSPPIRRVGKYRLDRVIGRGAVGIVYKGHDELIDRPLAIKTLRPEILEDLSANGEALQRFAAEVRSAGRCLHPNIVTVFDYVEEAGAPYIVMEYVKSGTLDNVIHSGVLPPIRQVGEIMTQLLLALDHAHSNGIIHRDIKPSNILCHSATSIKVADFGIAHLDTLDATKPTSLTPTGTPNYMAPERFLGRKADARSDLFSAGVVLFQLLSGTRPYVASDIAELMNKLMTQQPQSLATLLPDIWQALDSVVMRALARNPDDRFQTAAEFLDALNGAIEAGDADTAPPLDLTTYSGAAAGHKEQGSSGKDLLGRTMAERLLPRTLDGLEQTLARSVGPIARILVQRASNEATDIDGLLTALARSLRSAAEADKFRRDAGQLLLSDTGIAGAQLAAAIQPAEAEAVTDALLPLIGPIARPLVARHARTAIGREDFYDRLADELRHQSHLGRLQDLRKKFGARGTH